MYQSISENLIDGMLFTMKMEVWKPKMILKRLFLEMLYLELNTDMNDLKSSLVLTTQLLMMIEHISL